MAEIFISYARADRGRAETLAQALGQLGFSVWWDREIPPGRTFDEVIEEGFFPASPKEKPGCEYCDYLAVCGSRMQIDARRKQNDPRLSPLNWLRNLT